MVITKIEEWDFKSHHRPSNFDKAMDWLKKQQKDEFIRYCRFAVISEEGHIEESGANSSCHSALLRLNSFQPRDIVVTTIRNPLNVAEKFLTWLFKDSFASKFILNENYKDGGLVISTDMPAPLLQNVMILTRHSSEFYPGMESFSKLLSDGFLPEVAYNFVFGTTWVKGGGVNGDPRLNDLDAPIASYTWHRPWSLFDLSSLARFVARDFRNQSYSLDDATRFYRNFQNYKGGVNYCWDNTPNTLYRFADLFDNQEFREALSIHRHGTVQGIYRPPNPFAKHRPEANQITYKELFEVVCPFIHEKGFLPSC